jgi:plastocyanin
VAAVLVAALALGAGTVGAAPAQAAGLGTVTVTKVGNLLIFSPTEVTGAPGDTITVTNNSGVTILPILAGSTGTLKVGATTCDTGQATCLVTNGASLTYTLGSTGVITFESAAGDVAGPLNINAAGGGAATRRSCTPS